MPELLEEITMRCLQKNPEKRYDTMAEIIHLLQQDWRWELAPGSLLSCSGDM